MNPIKMLIYGSEEDYKHARLLLDEILDRKDQQEHLHVRTREELMQQLTEEEYHLVVILADGAGGMEGVYAVREMRPAIPLFWFSDDEKFSIHSHRLECDYFSTKPLSAMKMRKALQRCAHVGLAFT